MSIRRDCSTPSRPAKDVDGFHPVNVGRLLSGTGGDDLLAPCTPAGIMEILKRSDIPIAGRNAVVIGRSNIVGKPVAAMLINASATVTVCHSKTHDLASITRAADILVAAIGRPGFVTRRYGAARRHADRRRHQPHHRRGRAGAVLSRPITEHHARRATFAKRGSTVVGDIRSCGVRDLAERIRLFPAASAR